MSSPAGGEVGPVMSGQSGFFPKTAMRRPPSHYLSQYTAMRRSLRRKGTDVCAARCGRDRRLVPLAASGRDACSSFECNCNAACLHTLRHRETFGWESCLEVAVVAAAAAAAAAATAAAVEAVTTAAAEMERSREAFHSEGKGKKKHADYR